MKKKEAKAAHKAVFYWNKISPAEQASQLIMVKDETESGKEYFKFENDPHSEIKEQNAKFSENYYRDRYFVQNLNKEFLTNKGRLT